MVLENKHGYYHSNSSVRLIKHKFPAVGKSSGNFFALCCSFMNFHRELLARDPNYETNLHSIVDIAVRHVKSTQSAILPRRPFLAIPVHVFCVCLQRCVLICLAIIKNSYLADPIIINSSIEVNHLCSRRRRHRRLCVSCEVLR